MSLSTFRRIFLVGAAAFVMLFVCSADASAQSRREIERERLRVERENARYERDRRRDRRARNPVVTRRAGDRVFDGNYVHGYQEGLMAGQFDRRKGKYNNSNVYRDTGAYPNQGDPTSSDYIYRQGYLQGYQDGYNGIRNY